MSDLEKKHLPVISAPDTIETGECFEVTVEVGGLLSHPNENEHFIEFIDLYADDIFLARADLTPITTCPTVRFNVSLAGEVSELRAYSRCNLHGVWVAKAPIKVREHADVSSR